MTKNWPTSRLHCERDANDGTLWCTAQLFQFAVAWSRVSCVEWIRWFMSMRGDVNLQNENSWKRETSLSSIWTCWFRMYQFDFSCFSTFYCSREVFFNFSWARGTATCLLTAAHERKDRDCSAVVVDDVSCFATTIEGPLQRTGKQEVNTDRTSNFEIELLTDTLCRMCLYLLTSHQLALSVVFNVDKEKWFCILSLEVRPNDFEFFLWTSKLVRRRSNACCLPLKLTGWKIIGAPTFCLFSRV